MPKTNRLNGIPQNIGDSFLSTMCYYDNGYMADWLVYMAKKEKVSHIEIDVLNSEINPKNVEIIPLLAYTKKMRNIVFNLLEKEKFSKDFIVSAVLKFEIPYNKPMERNTVYCFPEIIDENGKIYKSKKKIVDVAYETNFKPKYIFTVPKRKYNLTKIVKKEKNNIFSKIKTIFQR